ncbi:tryptophan synthase subunit alpha, partial [Streptomyces mirabilis]
MTFLPAGDVGALGAVPWVPPGPGAATRLHQVISRAQAQDRSALAAYLPVGFPNRITGMDALHLLAQAADILELGIPHTDGVLDGPVIQQAAHTALTSGFRMHHVFDSARELATSSSAALLVMTYWQPLNAYGPNRFARDAAAAGIDGVLVPDLPLEEAKPWQAAAQAAGIGTIPLVSPRTRPDRLARIVTAATAMVYAPATDGVTGNSQPVSPRLP